MWTLYVFPTSTEVAKRELGWFLLLDSHIYELCIYKTTNTYHIGKEYAGIFRSSIT